ncbi:hypothetical protein DFQ28_005935 [Apophysomyces sp. BC1034]|nr:hypothetical protein DFQ30_006414 [Apophysomyces sp. BC1015]KAG0187715.1 hypothetical protein DFQ28_005935 [Apophysomyces sp. BC1034]
MSDQKDNQGIAYSGGRPGSKIVENGDPGTKHPTESKQVGQGAAETTYNKLSIDFKNNDSKFTLTPGRVAKNVFNKYNKNDKYKVFCYYTDWSQYDSRYGANLDDKNVDYSQGGRGTDIMRLKENCPFDKIVIGFAGIIGDQGEKKVMIKKAARGSYGKQIPEDPTKGFQILDDISGAEDNETQTGGAYEAEYNLDANKGKVTFTDPWGDVLSYMNCGFTAYKCNDATKLYNQTKAQGVLGALSQIQKTNSGLPISLSLGGWTMSQAFHYIAKNPDQRKRLVDGLATIITKFPMFTEIDVDWEYPGSAGNAITTPNVKPNDYGAEDPENFAQLIREIKANSTLKSLKISIATSAVVDKLKAANIPLLIDAGVDHLNLMSYDFFGTPWAERIMHHTNLKRDHSVQKKQLSDELETKPDEKNSTDDAIQYLIKDIRIDPKQIFVGYAGYTRNAKEVKTIKVTETTPLDGTYNTTPAGNTIGSFESGSTEWPDMIYNYLDLENKGEINGYKLYTDKTSNADFLYSETSNVFMSLDTPRSVKAKGEYVAQYDLGGMFIWTGDADNGLLTNAAREGLGFIADGDKKIDMEPFYFEGITTLNKS